MFAQISFPLSLETHCVCMKNYVRKLDYFSFISDLLKQLLCSKRTETKKNDVEVIKVIDNNEKRRHKYVI